MRLTLPAVAWLALLPAISAAAEPPAVAAKITEWQLPAPMFGRSASVAPDGTIYIAVPNDNKVLRFDLRTQAFREWEMPYGHQPSGILVDRTGTVWTAGYGNGTIGRLRPATGMIAEFTVPSGGGPHSLALSDNGDTLWFTLQTGDKLGSLDTATGRIAEYETSGSPSGIAIDRAGNVWWCRSTDNKLGRMEPQTGRTSELALGRGARPRGIAAAADGTLWVSLFGKGQLAKVNSQTMKVVRTYPLPGGNAGAHAVIVDSAGVVWINQLKSDTVIRFDTVAETMQTIRLPSPNNGIRNLVFDGAGRLWYVGSTNGKLGLIE